MTEPISDSRHISVATPSLARLLGRDGEPPACKVVSDTIAMHWFPSAANPGDRCLCGRTVKGDDGA